jgi:iron complex outermembrane receptor protein
MHKTTFKLVLVLALFCSNILLISQNKVSGLAIDAKSNDTLIGAIVQLSAQKATTTNEHGSYSLDVPAGDYTLTCSLLGYKTIQQKITIKEGDVSAFNFYLLEENTSLEEVVVSAGKYEQKLSEVTISMEVIKPSLIENKNSTNIDAVMNQVPGVTVNDGQASIRGGSGFSYGAGSRVLVMVDEMPMISADAGDVKWNYLPIENVEQIEVIKGASSALFGSSALNGVINLRTQYAKDKPITKLTTFFGSYDAPRNTVKWWQGSTQHQAGINFSHAQKLNNFDLVIGGHMLEDDGFRFLETESRKRFNANLRYNFRKIPGLSVGVNGNSMNTSGGLFFLWQNYDSAYFPSGLDLQRYNNIRLNIDPYVTYYHKNSKLSLRNRYFKTNNVNDKDQGSYAELYYSELQGQHRFENGLSITSGLVYMEQMVLGGALYGKRNGNNKAFYLQGDKKFFRKLTVSAGIRAEYFKIDTAQTNGYLLMMQQKIKLPFQPVARLGLNYEVAEFTFLRGSVGQGYRFPSIAEKFVSTSVSALNIFPNQALQPELGFSGEIGVKQGFKLFGFKGFIDGSVFYNKFKNNVEFVFDIYKPAGMGALSLDQVTKYAGFKSQNVNTAQIIGTEVSVGGTGKIFGINTTLIAGYTYVQPTYETYNPVKDTLGLPNNRYLKYRQRHLAKADVQFEYKWFAFGYSARFQSKTLNIDRRFVISVLHEQNDIPNGVNFDDFPSTFILPGFKENYSEFEKNVVIQDARVSANLSSNWRVSFIVNNLANVQYQARPGDLRPPTQYVFQLMLNL